MLLVFSDREMIFIKLVLVALQFYLVSASSPILIVPGILGNQMEAKLDKDFAPHEWCSMHSDWYTVWVSIEQLLPYVIDCWSNNTRLLFQNGEYYNCTGVQIRVPGFGETSSVEYLDPDNHLIPYFHHFVDYFSKHGYVKGVSLRAAPYDWRVTPDILEKNGYYDNLKQLVETMYKDNGNATVTVVAHSLGSPVSLYFLTNIATQQWKNKYLKAFITLSGVWKGAVKAVTSVVSGNPEGIPGIKPLTARYVQRSSPSNYFLMPVPDHNIWSSTDPIIVTPNKNYTVYDYPVLFDDMQYSIGYTQYKTVPSFLTTLSPPNVDTYCYFGTNMSTPATLVYKEGEFPDTFPAIVTGNGDGTVNDASLQACSAWKQTQSHKVDLLSFSGVEHFDMVKNSDVLQAVLDIVSN